MTDGETQDPALARAVADALRWVPSVNSAAVSVAVSNGTATLSGTVGTYPEVQLLVRATREVRGIVDVVQRIQVHGRWAASTDGQISRRADEMLRLDRSGSNSVTASVRDGVITLAGEVNSAAHRESAHRAVSYVVGVTGVIDRMTERPHQAEAEIVAGISAAEVRGRRVARPRRTRSPVSRPPLCRWR